MIRTPQNLSLCCLARGGSGRLIGLYYEHDRDPEGLRAAVRRSEVV